MRFASLGSGSKGNASLVEADGSLILIDCGFSLKQISLRLKRLGHKLEDIDAVFISHEHQDHIQGANSILRQTQIPVWASSGTANYLVGSDKLFLFGMNQNCEINNLKIKPIVVPHDAAEPCQFVISSDKHKLGILTDTGHITGNMLKQYGGCNGLMLESNYDETMLRTGSYPEFLKSRIAGDFGHLSNDQALGFLTELDTSKLQQLVLMHISEKNNSSKLAIDSINKTKINLAQQPRIACQKQGLDWLELV